MFSFPSNCDQSGDQVNVLLSWGLSEQRRLAHWSSCWALGAGPLPWQMATPLCWNTSTSKSASSIFGEHRLLESSSLNRIRVCFSLLSPLGSHMSSRAVPSEVCAPGVWPLSSRLSPHSGTHYLGNVCTEHCTNKSMCIIIFWMSISVSSGW